MNFVVKILFYMNWISIIILNWIFVWFCLLETRSGVEWDIITFQTNIKMNFVEEIHCNIFLPHSIRFDQSNGLIRSNSIIAHFGCLLSSRRYHPQIDSALNLQLFETIIQMNFVEEMNGNISLPHSFGFHQLNGLIR